MSRDPLRSTLDHLALDPDAGADRHYLVSVLRRLGYSEAEIRQIVGDEGRVIEVEYSGDGRTSFRFAEDGKRIGTFEVASGGKPMTFKLAGDSSAGTDTLEGFEAGDADISGDWSDDWSQQGGGFSVDGADWKQGQADGEEVEFRDATVQFRDKGDLVPFTVEGDEDPALAAGWLPVEEAWTPEPGSDDAWGPIEEAPGGAWAPAEATEATWEQVVPADDEAPFVFGEYTLYRRAVELTTGHVQDIYFFSKDEPHSGEPSPMPWGYEVAQSDKTGLPFLRKSEDAGLQCGALTHANRQCRITAQEGSEFCHLHQDYQTPSEDQIRQRLDTAPAWSTEDTLPGEDVGGAQQCAAITAAGAQCRNTARHGSKYCASHKGYHPRSMQHTTDTEPVGSHVRDTLPAVAERRIRTEVVQASSAAEAERLIQSRGGRVRSVVPVRVEDHEVQE